MFEKFLANNAADYRQRFEGTFGFFTADSGVRTLVQLVKINVEREPYVDFVNSEGVSFRLTAENDRGFEFIPPKSEWHNTKFGAAFVTRTAQRQWTRGVCERNTRFHVLRKGIFSPTSVDFPMLSELYEKNRKTSYEECIKNDRPSFALTPNIAMDFRTQQLYVLNELVGTYTSDNNLFEVKINDSKLWSQEISDAFRRNKLEFRLV